MYSMDTRRLMPFACSRKPARPPRRGKRAGSFRFHTWEIVMSSNVAEMVGRVLSENKLTVAGAARVFGDFQGDAS